MHRSFLITATILGAVTVALGAFGAHTLRESGAGEDATRIFETGVRYQFYHVLALFITAIIYRDIRSGTVKAAGWLFLTGILLFSGSLYFLTWTKATATPGYDAFGGITPFGGLAFMAGWVCLALAAFRNKKA